VPDQNQIIYGAGIGDNQLHLSNAKTLQGVQFTMEFFDAVLALHFESRQAPVFAPGVVKPGKLGPKITPHRDSTSCDVPLKHFQTDVTPFRDCLPRGTR
jgi:hypothetical protein